VSCRPLSPRLLSEPEKTKDTEVLGLLQAALPNTTLRATNAQGASNRRCRV